MTSRTIRPIRPADIASLQALDAAAHGESWSHRTFLDEIEEPDRVHLVAQLPTKEIVGHASAWIDSPSCRITNVAVAGAHVGHGHASALLLGVVHSAMAGYETTNMLLEVRPSNRRAQRLYNRFGFVPVGIHRGFYDHADASGNRDALVMAVADVSDQRWRQRLEELESEHVDLGATA